MAGRGRPGVEPMMQARTRFMALIAAGATNSEAAREVGVNRRTGTRWRYGRTVVTRLGGRLHYAPVSPPSTTFSTTVGSRFLDEDERIVISDLHRAGLSSRAIAQRLGRSHTTISREVRRNTGPDGHYGSATAQRLAVRRRRRPRARRLEVDEVLRAFVQACVDVRWSPEQISHALSEQFPGQVARQLVPESIYQAFYAQFPVIERSLRVRRWRRRRRPRRRPEARRALPLPMIGERPAAVEDRVEVGHWEGDLIMGPGNRSAIATLVERSTRTVILVHLPAGKTSLAVRDALLSAFSAMPAEARRSLTWDQGKEMADYAGLTAALGLPVYFCDPHSPWQRGSNENMNGLLRDYFPKGTDLSVHSAVRLAEVQGELNDRPRKTLDWATPAALITPHLQVPDTPLLSTLQTVVVRR